MSAAHRALLGLALSVVAMPTAAAQPAPASAPIRLAGQTAWVAEGQAFNVAIRVEGGLPVDGTIELTLYGAVTSRQVLTSAADDLTALGAVRSTLEVPTALVPRDADGAFRLRLPTDGSGPGLPVDDPGVYPLAIAVAGPDGPPGPPLVTFVVRTSAETASSPMLTAVVLPIHAPPSFAPDGSAVLTDGARRVVQVRSRLLRRYGRVPLTVAPTPETVDAVALEDPDLLEGLREALDDRHVVAGPYVRLDLAGWAANPELDDALDDQIDQGARVLRRTLRRPTDRRTWVVATNPTTAALDVLAAHHVGRALFRQEAVAFTDPPAPVTEPVVLTGATGQSILAVLADPMLRAHANSTTDPVLMAHRTLADLALLAATRANGGVAEEGVTRRGVVIELPANRALPAAFLDALLRGLSRGGPVQPVSLARLFDTDPAGPPGPEPGPVLGGVPAAGQDLGSYGRELAAVRGVVDGYASFAGGADRLGTDLRRRLLVSGAGDLAAGERATYLEAVSRAIQDRTAQIGITDDVTVTLTSREGNIPLTIHNDTGGPVEVRLSFDSDNKLDFPDGATQRLSLAEGPNRLEVRVVARASGSFPLRITATSPDGVLTVGRARVTVRSTVVAGVGVVLSIGAGLVLVGWWARHWHTARRNRRLVPVTNS